MTLTEKDHKTRSNGIGSSEIAMLIYVDGKPLSPWGGSHKLWRKKTGRGKEAKPKSYMSRGNYMESGILDWYAHDHGVAWTKPPSMRHPKHTHVVDSVDALTYDPQGPRDRILRCVEAKASHWSNAGEWGAAGTDEIPEYYIVQCQWHLGLHMPEQGICDVPMDNGTKRTDYSVRYDPELYLCLVDIAQKFWRDHIDADLEPPDDDHADTSKWLSGYLSQRQGMGYLEADDELRNIMLDYREMLLDQDAHQAKLDELKVSLMRAIGEYDGLVIPGTKMRISWKQAKDSVTPNWQDIAESLFPRCGLDQESVDEIKMSRVKVKKGGRRWVCSALRKTKGGR